MTWLGEALTRTKRLPSLKKLLGRSKPTRRQVDRARSAHDDIVARLGAPDHPDGVLVDLPVRADTPPEPPQGHHGVLSKLSDDPGATP